MNNEEKILALLETMNGRLDRLEAGQANLEAGQTAIQERLDQIGDKLDDVEAKNANQHIQTRSAIEKLAKIVKENTSDIARLKAAQ